IEALQHMRTYLASRPKMFGTVDEAIQWHIRSRTVRDQRSAEASVPSLLIQTPSGRYTWRTDLNATAPWWEDWFKGMSEKFLKGRGAKLLILAGTDRLDKDLMIGQMQGKFQLQVIPEAGHFVQEDVPEKAAQLLVEFFKRNDRGALVLPPKVSDLIAQGKKV
ncbi:protein phosphatase methylesterase 1, partial [Hortaea werneckii]